MPQGVKVRVLSPALFGLPLGGLFLSGMAGFVQPATQHRHMANVTYEKTSPITGRLQLSFTKEELSKKLNEELKKESKRVNIKGFRRGKTPLSALRKLMGNQVFGPLLDRNIQQELYGYIEENDIKLIFSPIPDESVPVEQISATNIKDLNLAYDLALEPQFELSIPEQAFTQYVLAVDEDFLDEQITTLRRAQGTSQEVEEAKIEARDILDVKIEEVDGELANTAKLFVDSLKEDFQDQFLGQEKDFSLVVDDLASLEENTTEDYVLKYLLGLDVEAKADYELDGKTFRLTVVAINRIVPAEMDEEFFTKVDPTGAVKNEDDLRAKITDENGKGFDAQGIGMVNFEIQRALVEGNNFELPTELMKKIGKDDTDSGLEQFERGVRWMLIRNKIAQQKDIQLEYEDIRAEAMETLMRMLGGRRPDFLTDEFVDNYVQNMLKDENQREELTSNALEKKIMDAIRDEVSIEEKPISSDEFNETIKEFNSANSPTPVAEEE